ncbi:GntR family transcriptional regulator [Caballeronia sp. LjRoot34]|uniref:GntR family transcriptional regulator n=1 Tax=Caballeronia sp. LjRoot34 TaxID=3342325 RepID=UPI003ECDB249
MSQGPIKARPQKNERDSSADETPGEAQSLPELAYRRLRANILSARIPPGSELRQERLAKEYGISRVPLREAMSRLNAERLLVQLPRRGYVVPSLTCDEIVEICEISMLLEEQAAVVATRVRTGRDVAEVESILQELEALDATDPEELESWHILAYKFHDRLFRSARRRRLHEVVANFRDAVEPYMRLEMDLLDHIQQSTVDHRNIFEAFRTQDTEAAGRLSRQHAENIKAHLLNSFANDSAKPGGRKTSLKDSFERVVDAE